MQSCRNYTFDGRRDKRCKLPAQQLQRNGFADLLLNCRGDEFVQRLVGAWQDEYFALGIPIQLEAFGMRGNPDLPYWRIRADYKFCLGFFKFDGKCSGVEVRLK